MWTIKISPAFFLASMLVFQSGCTNVKMIGSPDTDAMLIVGCDDISWAVASRIQWKLSSHNQDYPEPTDCWVAQVGESDNRSNNIKAISLDRSSGQSGLFVFPDLKPGTYHLSTIAANCQVRAPDPADPVDQGEYLTLFYELLCGFDCVSHRERSARRSCHPRPRSSMSHSLRPPACSRRG